MVFIYWIAFFLGVTLLVEFIKFLIRKNSSTGPLYKQDKTDEDIFFFKPSLESTHAWLQSRTAMDTSTKLIKTIEYETTSYLPADADKDDLTISLGPTGYSDEIEGLCQACAVKIEKAYAVRPRKRQFSQTQIDKYSSLLHLNIEAEKALKTAERAVNGQLGKSHRHIQALRAKGVTDQELKKYHYAKDPRYKELTLNRQKLGAKSALARETRLKYGFEILEGFMDSV